LTLPSIISGKPVISDTSVTLIPASARTLDVPPVEIISKPSLASPDAKSTIPVLSETLNSAFFGRMNHLT
jgi:hypothetical protein